MNVSNVMSTYNMSTMWNNINSSTGSAPLFNNIDATVKENYTALNYSGQTTSTELQDIYQQIEPTNGISVTYNQNGDISTATSTTLPTNGLTTQESNTISLLKSMNSATDNSLLSIESQYSSIENGTYSTSLSSILSSNPSTLYNSISSLGARQAATSGTSLDTTV